MGNSSDSSEDQIVLIEIWTVKAMLMSFQVETRILWGIGEMTLLLHHGKEFGHVLGLYEKLSLKVIEQFTWQRSFQASKHSDSGMSITGCFGEIYNENQKQKGAEWKDLEILQLGQERNGCEGEAKEGKVATEISISKKKPSTLHWVSRKDTSKVSILDINKATAPITGYLQECKFSRVESFQSRTQGHTLCPGLPQDSGFRIQDSFPYVQPQSCFKWDQVQLVLTADLGIIQSSTWYWFCIWQNIGVVES